MQHILLNTPLIGIIPKVQNKFSSPLRIYEYMSTSNIVIAPNSPTIKEIIKDGYNGFLFEEDSKKHFLTSIKRVLSLPEKELQQIAQNAYNSSKEFTWENRAKTIWRWLK